MPTAPRYPLPSFSVLLARPLVARPPSPPFFFSFLFTFFYLTRVCMRRRHASYSDPTPQFSATPPRTSSTAPLSLSFFFVLRCVSSLSFACFSRLCDASFCGCHSLQSHSTPIGPTTAFAVSCCFLLPVSAAKRGGLKRKGLRIAYGTRITKHTTNTHTCGKERKNNNP